MTFTEERALWLYENYRWLSANLPPRANSSSVPIALPTNECFPVRNTHDHFFAEGIYNRVKELMQIPDWPCELSSRRPSDQAFHEAMSQTGLMGSTRSSGAAGTFSTGPQRNIVITYSHELVKDPVSLIATLAHELSHYLLATVKTIPPSGWEQLEPLTDITAVAEGFGVFLCNSAFQFGQWTSHSHQGWSSRQQGYLSEYELGFCLGVFCVRNRIDPNRAARYLKPNARAVFVDSIGFVEELESRNLG